MFGGQAMRDRSADFAAAGVICCALAALCACGGGGDGSTPASITITASSPPPGTVGQNYAGYTFTATGGVMPLSWTASGNAPPGLALSPTGQLSGTPGSAATYSFTVTVTDSSTPPVTASAPVSLKIADSAIVISLPGTPPGGTATYPYPGFTLNVSGGSPPYTWKASGTLPPGLTLGSDGTVSGTPTAVGSFSFSVTATDSAQPPTSSAPLSTLILIAPPPPLVLNPTPAPPPGTVGTPYGPFNFSATGGYLPLHWSVAPGVPPNTLPPGLTLGSSDGSLSGTPTSAGISGTFTPTITVTDSASPPVSQSLPFSITVALPSPPTINDQEAPTATMGAAYTPYQFTATGGVPPLAWSLVQAATHPLPPGMTLSPAGVLSGTPTAAGMFQVILSVVDNIGRPGVGTFNTTVRVSLARAPASFTSTGNMTMPRSGHAATLLISGEVLITGGANGNADATAELYTPGNPGSFSPTKGNMTQARIGHAATLLKLAATTAPNYGKVLIVSTSEVGASDTTAELYDPASSTFTQTGSLNRARTGPTATLLNTGKVLIVGGNTTPGDNTAELYDPATGSFSITGSTIVGRDYRHTATLLNDGTVLIAGGGGTSIAELYDPTKGTFTETKGSFNELLAANTATLLGAADGTLNGYVLIVDASGRAYLYDPDPNTQSLDQVGSAPATQTYINHTASLRADGTVLITGGYVLRRILNCGWGVAVSAGGADLFAPESEGFTATGGLIPRDSQTATVLLDGTILVAGGVKRSYKIVSGGLPPNPPYCQRTTTALSSAEVFQ